MGAGGFRLLFLAMVLCALSVIVKAQGVEWLLYQNMVDDGYIKTEDAYVTEALPGVAANLP